MSNNKDKLLLENYVPYDKSIGWFFQKKYYGTNGKRVWLKGEIPYYATSNSLAAKQNAELVYTSIKLAESHGTLKPEEPINILEIASGLGLFAINFLNAFKELDDKNGGQYFSRLRYFFTDLSRKNLTDASINPVISKYRKKGVIILAELDALKPQKLKYLFSKDYVNTPKMTAVIANYVHIVLPVKVLKKKNGEFFEKYVKTSLKKTYYNRHIKKLKDVIADPSYYYENYVRENKWEKLKSNFYKNPLHRKIIEESISKLDNATIVYPYGSFASIEYMQSILIDRGMIIISDIAYTDIEEMVRKGESDENYVTSFVNLPLIETFARKLGLSVMRTKRGHQAIESILLQKGDDDGLESEFREHFINSNINLDACDYFWAGDTYFWSEKYTHAIRFFERVLTLGAKDSELFYQLGSSYAVLKETDKAFKMFKEGRKYDYFKYININLRIGYAFYQQGDLENAIKYYKKSLTFDKTERVFYNLGQCYEDLRNYPLAISYYLQSLSINPDYEKSRSALTRVTEHYRNIE